MARARPSPGGAAETGGAVPWLVLDLVADEPPAELTDAVSELAQAVAGVTVLVDGSRPALLDGTATLVDVTERGSAARLRQAEAQLPDSVDVVVYGDAHLLAADYRCSVRDALALFGAGDVALARGVPVTDSLRCVDDRDRLSGCVDRSQLFVLHKPQVLRRDVVGQIADLAADAGADGSVEAGLMRCPAPVRVVDIYPTAAAHAPASAVPSRF